MLFGFRVIWVVAILCHTPLWCATPPNDSEHNAHLKRPLDSKSSDGPKRQKISSEKYVEAFSKNTALFKLNDAKFNLNFASKINPAMMLDILPLLDGRHPQSLYHDQDLTSAENFMLHETVYAWIYQLMTFKDPTLIKQIRAHLEKQNDDTSQWNFFQTIQIIEEWEKENKTYFWNFFQTPKADQKLAQYLTKLEKADSQRLSKIFPLKTLLWCHFVKTEIAKTDGYEETAEELDGILYQNGNAWGALTQDILTDLKTLTLEDSVLFHLPSELFQLPNLHRLKLIDLPLEELSGSIGHLKKLKSLSLNELRLKFLPPEIGELKALKELSVEKVHLETLPQELAKLTHLKRLLLFKTEIKELPAFLGRFPELTFLTFIDGPLQSIPPEIGDLKTLKELEISDTPVNQLPQTFSRLMALEKLALDNNEFLDFPEVICDMGDLTCLSMPYNGLKTISPKISQLNKLTIIDFSSNNIQDLPSSLFFLSRLEKINFQDNLLKHVSNDWKKLKALKQANLSSNKIRHIHQDIFLEKYETKIRFSENPIDCFAVPPMMGWRQISNRFNIDLEFHKKNVQHIDAVMSKHELLPIHINLETFFFLTPPQIPLHPLAKAYGQLIAEKDEKAKEHKAKAFEQARQDFIATFEHLITGFNITHEDRPGYLSYTTLTETELKGKKNDEEMQKKLWPTLRGFLKTLVDMPIDSSKGEEKGWQIFPEHKADMMNALSYIFDHLNKTSDTHHKAMIFGQLVNGLLHCPTGQKEGVDTVLLALQGQMTTASNFTTALQHRLSLYKNKLWQESLMDGDNDQNVHILSYYGEKLQGVINVYSGFLHYEEKIGRVNVDLDPFDNLPHLALKLFLSNLLPQDTIAIVTEIAEGPLSPQQRPRDIMFFTQMLIKTKHDEDLRTLKDERERQKQAILNSKNTQENLKTIEARLDKLTKSHQLGEMSDAAFQQQKQQLEILQQQIKKQMPIMGGDLDKLTQEIQSLSKILRNIHQFERPFSIMDVVNYLKVEKLMKIDEKTGAIEGWKNFFDKDPGGYVWYGNLEQYPHLTLKGAFHILKSLKILKERHPASNVLGDPQMNG